MNLAKECYPSPVCEPGDSYSSITNSLNARKKRLETELDRINAALNALQSNPEVANLLELVHQANR